MKKVLLLAAALCGVLTPVVRATHPAENRRIFVTLNGQNQVTDNGIPGQGDPDGSAFARLEEDHATLLWEITYQNISGQSISGLHIHGPGATPTNNRPILIDFRLPASRPLPNGMMSGRMTSADDPGLPTKIAGIFFGDPSGFYLNLHTDGPGGFPNGAVRGQLPEPGTAGLLTLVAAGVLLRRRKTIDRLTPPPPAPT